MIVRRIIFPLIAALLCPVACAGVLAQNNILIEYHPDDLELAQRSMDVLIQASAEFSKRLPLGEAPVRVIIAHTYDEFLRYASRFSQVSVMGIAKPREGLIVVKSPRLTPSQNDYAGTLRHELVHILLYRNASPDAMPAWLNEGIAMDLSKAHRWDSMFIMTRLFISGRLIEYRNLDYAFLAPGDEMEFGEAYAQALSMTRYLRDWVGKDAYWKIILATKETPFPDALRKFTDKSPSDFWAAYQRSLWLVAGIGVMASGSFFTPAAILLIIAFIRKHRASKRILARMTAEEKEEDEAGIHVFSWDEVVEDPDAWKKSPRDEDEDR